MSGFYTGYIFWTFYWHGHTSWDTVITTKLPGNQKRLVTFRTDQVVKLKAGKRLCSKTKRLLKVALAVPTWKWFWFLESNSLNLLIEMKKIKNSHKKNATDDGESPQLEAVFSFALGKKTDIEIFQNAYSCKLLERLKSAQKSLMAHSSECRGSNADDEECVFDASGVIFRVYELHASELRQPNTRKKKWGMESVYDLSVLFSVAGAHHLHWPHLSDERPPQHAERQLLLHLSVPGMCQQVHGETPWKC